MSFLSDFKNYLLSQKEPSSKLTVKNYLADISKFVRWFESKFGEFSPEAITPQIIEQFKATQSSPASAERYLSSLRKFFNFLKLEGIVSNSPLEQTISSQKSTDDPWHLKDFKNYLYVYNASRLTIKNYLIDVKHFLAWAEQVLSLDNEWETGRKDLFSRINAQLIEEYKKRLIHPSNDEPGFSPATVNRKLSSLRKYFKWAQETGLITEQGNSFASELNAEVTENLRSPQNIKDRRSLSERELSELGTKGSERHLATRVTERSSYSKFPPIRLMQKSLEAGLFLFELAFITPPVHTLKTIEHLIWRVQGRPVFSEKMVKLPNAIKNLPKGFYAPLSLSTAGFPFYKKLYLTLRHKRPEWYKTYHSYPLSHYFHYAILIVFMSALGFGLYQNFYKKPSVDQAVLAATPPTGNPRILSFQGKLTDSSDNPITTPTALRFSIYDHVTASGSALKWQEVDTVVPDQDGIFSLILGNNSALTQQLFAEHAGLWLGVTVGRTPELTPRQQLATVAYAENADTLQGLPPITQPSADTKNVVLALDSSGNLTIGGTATPTFQATGGQFTLSGSSLLLTTTAGGNSDIIVSPSGLGKIDLNKPIQNTSNNNLLTAKGAVEVDDLFAILATSSGQTALTVNQNGAGPIISASSSGVAKFTVDNVGNTTIAGNVSLTGTNPTLSVAGTNSLSIDAGGSGAVNIAGNSTGDVNLAGGSGATGCTIANSTGNLTCTGSLNGGAGGSVNSGTFLAGNGSAAAPSYSFTNSQTTGLYRVGADILGISTAGTQRATYDASGNYTLTGGNTSLTSTTTTGNAFSLTDTAITTGTLANMPFTANAGNGQVSTGQSILITNSTTGGGGYVGLSVNVTGTGIGTGNKFLLDLNPGDVNKEIIVDSTGAFRPTQSVSTNTTSVGSPTFYFKNGYFDQITANTFSGNIAGGGTSSTSWTLGNTQTGDVNEALIFQRNSGSGNATLQWNAGAGDLRYLTVNYPFNSTYTVSDTSIGTGVSLYSGTLTNNTTGGTQKLFSLTNTGTGTTENGIYINNTGTGATGIEVAGTWTTGILTNNNSINAGTGALTSGAITTSGSFLQTGTTTFTTGSGAVSLNGNTTLASNKTLAVSGTGTITDSYQNTTGSAFNSNVTNTATSGLTNTTNAYNVSLTGTNNLTGSNILNGINFVTPTAATNNTFVGLNFEAGYTTLINSANFTVTGAGAVTATSYSVTGTGSSVAGGFWTRNTTSGYLFPTTLTDNVGIGIISPSAPLHVYNSSSATNTPVQVLRIEAATSGTQAAGFGTQLAFYGNAASPLGIINATHAGTGTVQSDLGLQVFFGSSSQELLTLRSRASRGYVGVGNTAPAARLEVTNSQGANWTLTDPTLLIDAAAFADTASNGSTLWPTLKAVGTKGQNTTGTTGQTAGNGTLISLVSGDGGNAPGGSTNGNGGDITIQTGVAGSGAGTAGRTGYLILNSTGGNVGIGTISPGELLTVNGGTSTKAMIGGLTTHTNLYSTYNTQTWSALEINKNGDGTNGSAGLTLSIVGGATTSGATGTISFVNKSSGTEGTNDLRMAAIAGNLDGATNTGNLIFYTSNANTLTERMRIDHSGNVGIGTTGPGGKLEIDTTNVADLTLYSGAVGLRVMTTDTATAGYGGVITLGGSYTGTTQIGFASVRGGLEVAGSSNGYLGLYTTKSGTGSVEAMRITSGGNVGIGTTNPSINLDVKSANTTTVSQIGLANSDTSRYLSFYSDAVSANGPALLWNASSAALRFGTGAYNASSFSELMRITSTGNVGIGTTSPTAKLDLAGGLGVSGRASIHGIQNAGGRQRYVPYGGLGVPRDLTAQGSPAGATTSNDGTITWSNTTNAWTWGWTGPSYSRLAARAMEFTVDTTGLSTAQADHFMIGWGNGTSMAAGCPTNNYQCINHAFYLDKPATGVYTIEVYEAGASRGVLYTATWGDTIHGMIVLRSTGAYYYVKRNNNPNWELLYSNTTTDTTATLYAQLAGHSGRYTVHDWNVYDQENIAYSVGNSYLALDSGSVGIGLTSFGVNGLLQINGNLGFAGNQTIRMNTNADGNTLTFLGTQVVSASTNAQGYSYTGGGRLVGISTSGGNLLLDVGGAASTATAFQASLDGTGTKTILNLVDKTTGTSTFYADSSTGKVGIGTTGPGRTLDVLGSWGGNNVTSGPQIDCNTTITISTSALAYRFTIQGNNGTTETCTFNITGLPNTDGTFAFISTSFVSGTGGVDNLVVQINGSQISTGFKNYLVVRQAGAWRIHGTPSTSDTADIAEWYPVDSSISGTPEPGDVVTTGGKPIAQLADSQAPQSTISSLIKANKAYQGTIVGVISTKPYLDFGTDFVKEVPARPLALIGRVPVKVSVENGAIKIGDHLTSSATMPGYAMKATQAGRIIGVALEKFDGTVCDSSSPSSSDFGLVSGICTGKILVFVNPGYYDPTPAILTTILGAKDFVLSKISDGSYQVTDALGNIVTRSEVLASAVIGNLRAGAIQTQELIANSISSGKVTSPLALFEKVKTDEISNLTSDKLAIKLENPTGSTSAKPRLEIQNASGSAVTTFDDKGNGRLQGELSAGQASISGRLNAQSLSSDSASVSGTLRAKNIQADNIDSALLTLKSQISNFTSYQATSSAAISIASYSSQLANVNNLQATTALFSQGFSSLGPASLMDTSIFGQLSISGTLILADNAINVLGGDLNLQPLKQGGISFLSGKVYIDVNGNMTLSGDATVKGSLYAGVISPVPGQDLFVKLLNKNATESAQFKVQNASGSAVASIDSEGNATFKKLNLNLISPAYALSQIEIVATGSAGIATMSANFKELTIDNKLVTDKSLIYITPVGTPSGQIPYLLRQTPGKSFTVGVENLLPKDLQFNWLIIN